MKNNQQSSLVITLSVIFFIEILSSFYLKAQEFKSDIYVSRFDVNIMAMKYLQNYKFVRKRALWNYGREFVYQNNNTKECIFITIGLHPSSEIANSVANNYLTEMSVRMSIGFGDKKLFGDKLWYLNSSNDSNSTSNIVFLRKNALIILSCSPTFRELFLIAKEIDDGIIKGESFVRLNTNIVPPQIMTLSSDKSIVKSGSLAKITINARDIDNELLEYQFSPGLIKQKMDTENVFTFESSDNFIDKSGIQMIKAVVINESNVVSPIVELKIRGF